MKPAGRRRVKAAREKGGGCMGLAVTKKNPRSWMAASALMTAGALGALAVYNARKAREAEARNRPRGQWISVEGVRLHYIVKGDGPALTLIHGNLAMAEDFVASGLFDELSGGYRVYLFDRPGYGYSDRPGRLYAPSDYARLLRKALEKLGVERVTAVGHSFGALVAMAFGLEHPAFVERLAVIGGYFYPSPRLDVPLLAPPAIPLLGDLMRYTVSPLLLRFAQPALYRILFAPAPPPERFWSGFPHSLARRPLQIRAQAEDAAVMVPAAVRMQERYRNLSPPLTIIAGADDRWVDQESQSARLHREVPHSRFELFPGVGHIAHYTALSQILSLLETPQLAARREPAFSTAVSSAKHLAVHSGARPGESP
jgi:pimeloyl-ACP methyl ester carboxylesterase